MSTKAEAITEMLKGGWVTVPDLLETTGWKPHTLRAALSGIAKKLNVRIERKRQGTVTSYRIAE
jgi:hypothetical protein